MADPTTTILSVRQETPTDRTFRLALPPGVEPSFVPGQFVVLIDPAAEKPVKRAYSISSAPGDPEALEITVRDMGSFGHSLYAMPVGKELLLRAPQGRFVLEADTSTSLVLVAGGSGVTPFRSFVRHLATQADAPRTHLFQSAQQAGELIFHDEFVAHAEAHPWFDYTPVVTRAASDDPWAGHRGRIDGALLADALAAPEAVRFYACGPGAFVKAMLAEADAAGVPLARRHKEQWG